MTVNNQGLIKCTFNEIPSLEGMNDETRRLKDEEILDLAKKWWDLLKESTVCYLLFVEKSAKKMQTSLEFVKLVDADLYMQASLETNLDYTVKGIELEFKENEAFDMTANKIFKQATIGG